MVRYHTRIVSLGTAITYESHLCRPLTMPKILAVRPGAEKKSAWPPNGIGHSALHALRRVDISDLYETVYTVN
jgi:hypothetical protein